MIDVLLVAYHYPPIVSGGTERAKSFVRHLPEFGYQPRVLTTDTFGTETPDHAFRAGELIGAYRHLFNRGSVSLPPQVRSQHRTESSMSSLVRPFRDVLIPDGQVGWLPSALRQAGRVIDSHDIRAVITTGPPFSSHLLGYALMVTRNLPWIADFRDSWTYDPLDNPGRLRLRIEELLEAAVLERATRVTCATDVQASVLRSRTSTEVTVLENGYAKEDISDVGPESDDTKVRFVHTGSFSASHPNREPGILVDAAAGLNGDFEIVFVGHLTDEERKAIQPLESLGRAVITGAVSRDEALRWQRKADVLVVVDHPRAVLASNIPGKVYEYGASGKPILAVASAGATRDLIRQTGGGVCAPHDVQSVREAMQMFMAGTGEVQSNPQAWERFERRHTVKNLAAILDRCGL